MMEARRPVRDHILNFNIDDYINPLLPPPLYRRLPRPVSRLLGHRPTSHREYEPPQTLQTIHSLISIFAALLAVSAITQYAPAIHRFAPPILIPSLGAGAILNFITHDNPTAQPRATIFGQAISAAVGVGIAKLFEMNPNFTNLQWIATPLSVAVAGLAMRLTNTVHPPGGATAALAVGSSEIRVLGWWLVALITVGTTVMVGVGMVLNNVGGRKWPEFWWTATDLPARKAGGDEEKEEKQGDDQRSRGSRETAHQGSDLEKTASGESQATLRPGACPCCGRG